MKKKFPSEKELKSARKKLDVGVASKTLPASATVVEKVKFGICQRFIVYKRDNNLSQRELSVLIEMDEALVSKILHYNVEEFTVDRLLKYLSKLYEEIELKVKVA